MTLPNAEVDWDRLDKQKFFIIGAGLFSGISAMLFPITVLKTRMQVQSDGVSRRGMLETYRQTIRHEGMLGLYKGFGTVVMGTIPARAVYLGTLEVTKSAVTRVTTKMGVPEATSAGLSNGLGGLVASTLTQTVIVPIDVVSQRLMVQDGQALTKYKNGADAFRGIFRKDGLRGLYRGFGLSILTYGPSSGVWWGSYGTSQRIIWRKLQECRSPICSAASVDPPPQHLVVAVQGLSGLCAGAISAVVTTPLDVVKTRFQVLENKEGGKPSIKATVRTLMKEDGWKGFYRGIVPRWASTSLWGTCMVTTYEFLKRLSRKPDLEN